MERIRETSMIYRYPNDRVDSEAYRLPHEDGGAGDAEEARLSNEIRKKTI